MDEAAAWMARAAIAELITRYAALTDAGDWDALAALYTEDGRMNRPTAPDEFVSGRSAILAAFRSRPQRISRHMVANVLVTLEGDARARATSQILLFTGRTADDGGLPLLSSAPPLVGTYDDTLVRTTAGWRFAERRGRLDFRA
jgi:3-phenylpropionate/cinnamic acid dioxygenase small subunit